MLKGGSRGWSSDQLSISSALSFWYLHPQPLAGPQASAPAAALPTAEGIPSCTAPGYPRVFLLLLNLVPASFAVASVDLISVSEGTLCSVLPLSQTLDHIFFPGAYPEAFTPSGDSGAQWGPSLSRARHERTANIPTALPRPAPTQPTQETPARVVPSAS